MHHPRRVMRETMPTSYAYIKGAPGLGPVQGPCIRRTPRSWPRSPAQLCGSPQYLERPSPHTSSLGSIKASHSRAPHSRSAAAAVGVPRVPHSTLRRGPGTAGFGDPGTQATRPRWLPPARLLLPRATGLQNYSFPRCHGNFLLLIRTKRPPLLAPVVGP